MKEWLIRLICVLLGVVLTLGSIHLKTLITDNDYSQNEVEEVTEPIKPIETAETTEDTESEEEAKPDYDLEAELKFQDLMDKMTSDKENKQESDDSDIQNDKPEPGSIESAPVKWIKDYPMINSDSTLEDKLATRSSYEETMAVNAFDKMVIENSNVDFSKVKITVMGDSIAAASNLDDEEREKYNWPKQLEEILGCKEVVNLGIGGSTVCSCVDHYPMCERWSEIDKDSDIIIVMGGSNDMLFENKWQFGEIEYEKRMVDDTFCGDLDDMLSRMKWTYREHNDEHYCKLIYINPPSTILNDAVYALDTNNMVHQKSFAEAINTIAPQYGFEVIDMYNNNILNSHDPDINSQFVYDGIHCNKEGYRILAEHVASQIIQRIEQ